MRGNSTDQVLDFILVTIADEVLKVRVEDDENTKF